MYGSPTNQNPLDNPQTGFFGGSGWNSFGNGGHPGGGGGGGNQGGGGGGTTLPSPIPNEKPNNTTPGTTGAPDPNNFGQAMHPWDMPYGGQFTAPMSPYENNALGGFNNFVQGGMGLNQSGNYLNDVLGGKYLNLNSNPYLQQIQQGEQGIKDYNDKQAMDRIGSSMALGGNALSGARLGASSDYMRNSNNAFESMMGQLMNQNYGMERNAMNQAPGQAANLANTASGAYGQLFGMGALPRNLQQHDLDSQYNDFMRQTGALNHDSERPDNQLLQFLSNAGYKGQYQPTYGSSQGDILGSLFGQSGAGQTIWDLINGIGSGISGDTGSTGNDGVVIGHDATPSSTGPANYYDRDWYQNALQQAKIKQIAGMQKQNPNSNGTAIAALLMSILGGAGGKKAKSGGVGMGGGPSLANNAGNAAGKGIKSLWDSITGKNNNTGISPPTDEAPGGGIPQSIWDSMNSGNFNPGSQGFDQTLTNDIYNNPEFYQTDNSLPSIPFGGGNFSDFGGGGGGDGLGYVGDGGVDF